MWDELLNIWLDTGVFLVKLWWRVYLGDVSRENPQVERDWAVVLADSFRGRKWLTRQLDDSHSSPGNLLMRCTSSPICGCDACKVCLVLQEVVKAVLKGKGQTFLRLRSTDNKQMLNYRRVVQKKTYYTHVWVLVYCPNTTSPIAKALPSTPKGKFLHLGILSDLRLTSCKGSFTCEGDIIHAHSKVKTFVTSLAEVACLRFPSSRL